MAQHDESALDEWSAQTAAVDDVDALRACERRFSQIFGPPPTAMVTVSLETGGPNVYLAVNDAFCELTGYTRQELGRGDFLGDFHPDDQPALEGFVQAVTAGETTEILAEARLVRKDGGVLCTCLTGSAIQAADGGRYLSIFIEDSTAAEAARVEIGRLEAELQRSRRMESVGQLVGGIAHDFNNLLTVIANYASLVRDEVSVAEATESATRWEPVRWDVEQIEDAADRAKRLIKHLLAFARREEGQPVPVDFGQLIDDVTRLLRDTLGEHIPLIARHGAGLWPVQADPGLLEQVIMNIAVNARDAMPAGGRLTIETANIDTATLAADRPDAANLAELLPGRYVELRITDTGIGMDASTAERAFDPFFTTKSGGEAAGLGLPAVARFTSRVGGKAWLRSEPGRGTTVTVIVPAAPGSESGVTGPSGSLAGAARAAASSVLVVDDEAAIRDVAHRVLTSAGYRVMTAANGPDALELLQSSGTGVDVLLTDVVMPGMTGEAFAARVRAMCPAVRVLFMSGYEQPPAAAGGWPDLGAQMIAKPFSRAALLARITQVLTEDAAAGQAALPAEPAREDQMVRVLRGRGGWHTQ